MPGKMDVSITSIKYFHVGIFKIWNKGKYINF